MLTCPHCGFSKEMEEARLPAQGTTVNCPKCSGQFPLERCPAETGEAPTALPRTEPAPAADDPAAPASSLCADGAPPSSDSGAPAAPRKAPSRRTLTFSFAGNAREYFGIWIVNTLLRIVTLGIYSPWAKVRKRRYFYGNTLLDNASFDYLADPLAILKGWFIAGAFFGLYSFATRTSPIAAAVMMLLFLGIYPWVMVRSRIFNMRNSSHRNIRFSFRADYRSAYKVYLWWSLLIPLTLGILAPYVLYRQKRFLVENSAYGSTFFAFDARPKEYYRIFSPLLVVVPVLLAGMAGLTYLPKAGAGVALPLAVSALFVITYLAIVLYLPTAISNLTWSATHLGGHRFLSRLRVRDLAWIYFSNAVAAICTLGLLAPWGAVRLARYRLEKLTLSGIGELDSILAAQNEDMGATGEELGDMLGWDFGL